MIERMRWEEVGEMRSSSHHVRCRDFAHNRKFFSAEQVANAYGGMGRAASFFGWATFCTRGFFFFFFTFSGT